MSRLRWFNVSSPRIKIKGYNVWLWTLFNRHSEDGEHWWGFGLLQVGSRHLFFVGYCGVNILFVGRT